MDPNSVTQIVEALEAINTGLSILFICLTINIITLAVVIILTLRK